MARKARQQRQRHRCSYGVQGGQRRQRHGCSYGVQGSLRFGAREAYGCAERAACALARAASSSTSTMYSPLMNRLSGARPRAGAVQDIFPQVRIGGNGLAQPGVGFQKICLIIEIICVFGAAGGIYAQASSSPLGCSPGFLI